MVGDLKRVYFRNRPDDTYWQTGETTSTVLFWIENGAWDGDYQYEPF